MTAFLIAALIAALLSLGFCTMLLREFHRVTKRRDMLLHGIGLEHSVVRLPKRLLIWLYIITTTVLTVGLIGLFLVLFFRVL